MYNPVPAIERSGQPNNLFTRSLGRVMYYVAFCAIVPTAYLAVWTGWKTREEVLVALKSFLAENK